MREVDLEERMHALDPRADMRRKKRLPAAILMTKVKFSSVLVCPNYIKQRR